MPAALRAHDQHLALGYRTFIIHTGEFAYRQVPIVIHDRAFRPHSAQRCAATPQIGEIGRGFGFGFDRVLAVNKRLSSTSGGAVRRPGSAARQNTPCSSL